MTDTTIYVCDDENDLREMVSEYLTERGYDAQGFADGRSLLAALELRQPGLCILDVNMPGMDGMSVLREVRAKGNVPVIMLTAAAETVDRIVGLELGADDYIGKPVDLRELEARVKTVLRRMTPHRDDKIDQDTERESVAFGPHRLDLDQARMFDAEGEEITITAMEYQLLKTFHANRGRILNRDQLLEQAHDRGWEPFDRSIDLRISRLRHKIERNPQKPEIIRTVRGLGYIFS
ncbi:response regulator transcription factor [Qipengyuania aurantiaca]|uniref:Response regulator transcription factor n=1 Tax=Qipengyuania aurantiaca TaxID=2867233 RepID=A0ABX8ZPN4_9SPHN|nr:response regulator transcription factor [Qipengyuania aurantiaca]QZD90983.1 response regulator transcription factor [Qipengyuania aurantiaca]